MLSYVVIIGGIVFYFYRKNKKNKDEQLRLKEQAIKYNQEFVQYQSIFDDGNANEIVTAGKKFAQIADSHHLDLLYKDALSLIKDNPQCKTYALEIGRIKYGHLRENGSPSLYDESAIQNDIIAAQ